MDWADIEAQRLAEELEVDGKNFWLVFKRVISHALRQAYERGKRDAALTSAETAHKSDE